MELNITGETEQFQKMLTQILNMGGSDCFDISGQAQSTMVAIYF